jgi:hypothetical protein
MNNSQAVSQICGVLIKIASAIRLSVCRHETVRESLNGFHETLARESIIKLFLHIPVLFEIGEKERALYTKKHVRFCACLEHK